MRVVKKSITIYIVAKNASKQGTDTGVIAGFLKYLISYTPLLSKLLNKHEKNWTQFFLLYACFNLGKSINKCVYDLCCYVCTTTFFETEFSLYLIAEKNITNSEIDRKYYKVCDLNIK